MPELGAPLSLPPRLTGVATAPGGDALAQAIREAASVNGGTLYWTPDADRVQAALVLIPDRPLAELQSVVFAVACALHDCLGALAPPETAVSHRWPGEIRVNGARCGRLRAVAPAPDPEEEERPQWFVVGLELALAPLGNDPGDMPDQTSLAEEGCAGLTTRRILESWARHTVHWIYRWMEDGLRPVHDSWLARADGREHEIEIAAPGGPVRGTVLGLDEQGGLLLHAQGETRMVPLTVMLERGGAPA